MPRFNRMVVNGAISDRNIFRHSVFVQVKCLQATNTKKYLLLKPHRLPSQEDVGKGNLAGMRAELYDETYDTVSDIEQVNLYLIPLEYDLPQDAALEAMIGFYQDKLCMTAIHIKVSWEIPNVPTPVIWSLDVGKDTVEKWKSEFLRFPHQVVS